MKKKRHYYDKRAISFYPKFDSNSIRCSPASYFDSRWAFDLYLSHFLFIGLAVLVSPWMLLLILLPKQWGHLYVHIPFTDSGIDECDYPEYGFYYYAETGHESLWLCLGKDKRSTAGNFRTKHKVIYMPWSRTWMRTSHFCRDLTWIHEKSKHYPKVTVEELASKSFWNDEQKKVLWLRKFPYTYTLKNGTVQNRTATVGVSEREWRQRWLTWTSWNAEVSRTIDVNFDDEVGERTGSWKGGTMGCGYVLNPNESPRDCLRRMERERIFN